jgi:hypothetical protein
MTSSRVLSKTLAKKAVTTHEPCTADLTTAHPHHMRHALVPAT